MSVRFYINLPLCAGPCTLDGPEAHHLASVCRLRPGDEVCLFNGDGQEYPARVIQSGRREVSLEILGVLKPDRELPFPLELASPLPKGDRSQFLVEKLTELGVTRYVPLACRHSVIHPREGKRDKLQRYVIEASKQCGRNVLMEVAELTEWEKYAESCLEGEIRILAHPHHLGEPAHRLMEQIRPHGALRIAVGPEGGFTAEEVTFATDRGWQTVDLGPRILRIETAALALAALAVG
jgi:16S rRNA (uracil1498-N3)-methyltransferase